MNEHEEGIIRFIQASRRNRVRHLIKSGQRSWLAHLDWFDHRYIRSIPPAEHSVSGVLRIVSGLSPETTCYAIAESPDTDGKRLPLLEALVKVTGLGAGTLLSIEPGRLAFYEGEEKNRRLLLYRED